MELISGRGAADLLAWAGLGERQARAVIAAGLAGDPERVRGALLYDVDRVRALCDARLVSDDEVSATCPRGLFIARGRGLTGASWAFSLWTAVWLLDRIGVDGQLPAVATVGSFVTGCAEIIEVHGGADGFLLTTREPTGAWAATFTGARLLTGRGRPWVLLKPRPSVVDPSVADAESTAGSAPVGQSGT